MQCRYLNSIFDIDCAQWNAVAGTNYPFTRYEFLAALEHSGATVKKTGWQAQHLTVYQNKQLIAVMPAYIKHHSYGEYMFDWSWADAYHRHGLAYYPKLLAAIPFTPATGPRLCLLPTLSESEQATVIDAVNTSLIEYAEQHHYSSVHVLFPHRQQHQQLAPTLKQRRGVQFHWFNEGYQHFDDFLAGFNSRKRKALKKERRAISQQGVSLERLTGEQISPELWQQFFLFYQITYAKRSGHGGYLNQDFFQAIAEQMPEQIMLVVAKQQGQIIAGALNFFDDSCLYGRYWGCSQEVEFLHFEACYYQGIEFCIERGLQRFDPGAQGEHKIQRGFTPIDVYSNHWLAHPEFAAAIGAFLKEESKELQRYKQQCSSHLPFKKD